MSQKLVEIPVNDWIQLRDLYAIEHKNSPSGYVLLQNFITWHKKEPDMPFKIYSLNGNWTHDGTFIIEDNISQSSQIYCNTLSENLTSLTNALNCLHTSLSQVFCGFPERILPAVHAHATHVGVPEESFNPIRYIWYQLPKAAALELDVSPPEGITLKRLKVCHAEQVNNALAYRYPCSIDYIQRLLRLNESVGAFNASGELLAWCLISPYGALGLLHVVNSARRLGLGSLMVRKLSQRIAMDDMEVLTSINPLNQASCSMFEKLGFRQIGQLYWYPKLNKEGWHVWTEHRAQNNNSF